MVNAPSPIQTRFLLTRTAEFIHKLFILCKIVTEECFIVCVLNKNKSQKRERIFEKNELLIHWAYFRLPVNESRKWFIEGSWRSSIKDLKAVKTVKLSDVVKTWQGRIQDF